MSRHYILISADGKINRRSEADSNQVPFKTRPPRDALSTTYCHINANETTYLLDTLRPTDRLIKPAL